MSTCAHCGGQVEPNAERCRHCGKPRDAQEQAAADGIRIDHERLADGPRLEALGDGQWGKGDNNGAANAKLASVTPIGEPRPPEPISASAASAALAVDARPAAEPGDDDASPISAEVVKLPQPPASEDAPAASPTPSPAASEPPSDTPPPPESERPTGLEAEDEDKEQAVEQEQDEEEREQDDEEREQDEEEREQDDEEREQAEEPQAPAQPPPQPRLASEALRKDIAPGQPRPGLIRVWAVLLGLCGIAATFSLVGVIGSAIPIAGTFAALVALGAAPMPYPARAAGVVTIAATGLGIVTWSELASGSGPDAVLLQVGIVTLCTALLFRAWHRASYLARALLALGLAICVGWLWMGGALSSLATLETQWQGWVPRVLQIPFALLLMLCLLGFMDARSTGGAGAWATGVLLWYCAHLTAELGARYVPAGPARADLSLIEPQHTLGYAAAPVFAALLSIGLAQLLAVAMSDTRDRA